MSNESKKIKKKFDALFAEWERVIDDLKTQVSSTTRPKDYTDNEPYREIVKLGKDALPFIIEKLEQGVFFLNQAFLDIAGIEMDEVIRKVRKKRGLLDVFSEKEKSALLVQWWRSQEK